MDQQPDPNLVAAARRAEERTNELIREFHEHYQECVRAHPEHAHEKREIFEAWAIQKIAGLQLCVEHMAQQFNDHVRGHELRGR